MPRARSGISRPAILLSLVLTTALSACSSIPARSVQPPNYYAPPNKQPDLVNQQFTRFSEAVSNSQDNPKDEVLAGIVAEQGIVLVNMLCHSYFRSITDMRQTTRYQDGLTTNIGTVIGALLNLDGASHLATGGVTAITGGLSADFKSRDTQFIPAPDLAEVKTLVSTAMDRQADELRALPNVTYSQASVRLMRIAESCDFTGIQSLVSQSTKEGVPKIQVDESGNAVVSNAILSVSAPTAARQHQARGFDLLHRCRWEDARAEFEKAEATLQSYQGSYEFERALRNANQGEERQAVLAVPMGRGGDFMPSAVRRDLSSGKCR